MSKIPNTLEELKAKIDNEVDYIDVKPYSHNIIGMCLMAISSKFGEEEAEKAIEEFGLKEKGWR